MSTPGEDPKEVHTADSIEAESAEIAELPEEDLPDGSVSTETSNKRVTFTDAASTDELTSELSEGAVANPVHPEPEMKRAAAAKLIEKYYFQLIDGCGSPDCKNQNCFSSGKVAKLTNDEAAGRALQLLAAKAQLCESRAVKVARTSPSPTGLQPAFKLSGDAIMGSTLSSTRPSPLSPMVVDPGSLYVASEEEIIRVVRECQEAGNYTLLRRELWKVFSSEIVLHNSFLRSVEEPNVSLNIEGDEEDMVVSESGILRSKEEIRAEEGDLDKDLDSVENEAKGAMAMSIERGQLLTQTAHFDLRLDVEAVRRVYVALFECPEPEFSSALMTALVRLLQDRLNIQLRVHRDAFLSVRNNMNIFVIILENPALNNTEYIEVVLPGLCKAISQLPESHQAMLAHHLSTWGIERVRRFLESLHQLITIKLLTTDFNREFTINDEESITGATQLMKVLYYACIIGGQLDLPLLKDILPETESADISEEDPFHAASKDWPADPSREPPLDPLGSALGVHVLDCRIPLVPFCEFYDEFLSDQLEMDRDFAYYKAGQSAGSNEKFTFLNYPFILSPATKSLGLYYDNRIRMYSERRLSIYRTVVQGMPPNPYMRLRVRRDNLIDDALVELEVIAMENPGDLKKQLVVEFEGEQGIDEGGVSKEFFQLIIDQIFNPDFAMFCLSTETQTFWFNPTSFESDAQFTLVGLLLGLAIYNNIILDVHFPPVLYKKLCGKPGSFPDLQEWNTTLYRSLENLLNYEGEDMEETFMQTFRVGYQDAFGANLTHDLKCGADDILVNQHNKKEFVALYADFMLNKMAQRQFRAFRRGFNMVTDDSPLAFLFRPEELELLVCGSQQYDFMELMKSTEYDGGYGSETSVIVWFWELVHEMESADQKKLLQFTTGSARVPVGGLARLKLIIARHGADSMRLPTAHTCFNVLLLPEYASKEKLRDRLHKAITYSQGFGML